MTTKTYEEFMSEINSMNIEEALANAKKCLEAFEVRDIVKQQQETIESQQAEIERLCLELDEVIIAKDLLFDEAEALIKKTKAEAVKEFAERLKTKKHECGCNFKKKPVFAVTEEKIDETYKEMVGEGL